MATKIKEIKLLQKIFLAAIHNIMYANDNDDDDLYILRYESN